MDFTPATILLVEDHVVTRRFLAENLAADGYTVLEAPSVNEGERLIATAYPDMAILDLGLADGDGLELLARLRARARTVDGPDPELPVLILTGRGGELDRLRGFGRGADDYVTKRSASFPRSASAARRRAGNSTSPSHQSVMASVRTWGISE